MTKNEALRKISEGLQADITRYTGLYEEARKKCFDALTDLYIDESEVQARINDTIRWGTARQIAHNAYFKVESFMDDEDEHF